MVGIRIDSSIESKLKTKHNVNCSEVRECFANVSKGYLEDTREDYQKEPKTYWFVEQTDHGRWLFIAFLFVDGEVIVKTAFDADEKRKKLYMKLTGK